MLETLYAIVLVILLFGITIFVHELGHFLVARWCGLVAEVFSIGFGPALWKKKINGVVYKIGILPLGGYVALPQMDPSSGRAKDDDARSFPAVSPWRKILVALAGVTGNMILAVILAYIIFWVGKPSLPEESNAIVGFVDEESAAYQAGLRIGHEILTVNGEEVRNWNDISVRAALTGRADLEVQTPDGVIAISLPTEDGGMGVRVLPGLAGMSFCKVAATIPDSSAARAGIQRDDLILEVDGVPLYSRGQMIDLIQDFRDQDVKVSVERAGERVELVVRPAYDAATGRALIGVQFNTVYADSSVMVHPDPWGQIHGHATLIFRFLRALVTPHEARAAAQGVGGPLAIFAMFWWAVKSSFMLALWFTCFLNVNLAVLNLLPIPILDGGHIVFAVIESIRRKPLSPRLVGIISNVFVVLLLALFLFLSYRDAVRLVIPSIFGGDRAPAVDTNAVQDAAVGE